MGLQAAVNRRIGAAGLTPMVNPSCSDLHNIPFLACLKDTCLLTSWSDITYVRQPRTKVH